MGILGNAFKAILTELPQTVEGCDRAIADLEKQIINANTPQAKKSLKSKLVDVKAQRKKLKAKK